MEQKYRDYVIYIDDRKFKYTIFKEFVPTTNARWYNFIDANLNSAAENSFLLHSKHIKVYIILPSVGDDLLITEFDTKEVFKEKKEDNENDGYISCELDLRNNEERNEKGIKYDTGKPLVGTMLNVFPNALMGIGQLIEFGTHKYPSPTNCLLVNDGDSRYKNALMRHLVKHSGGEILDEETKLPHLYAVAWNALILIEFFIKEHPELRVFDDNRNIE